MVSIILNVLLLQDDASNTLSYLVYIPSCIYFLT